MDIKLAPAASFLVRDEAIHRIDLLDQRSIGPTMPAHLVLLLEMFSYSDTTAQAYSAYSRFAAGVDGIATSAGSGERPSASGELLFLFQRRIRVLHGHSPPAELARALGRGANTYAVERYGIDKVPFSDKAPAAVRVLASKGKNRPDLWPRLSASQFDEIVRTFANDGLLVAVHRAADVGYFRKSVPLCPYFGFSRGTPIDRYYLSQFVKEIRQEVRGSTLEIGGDTNSRVAYGFSEAAAYRTLDIDEDARADIVADVHSPTACAEESFDSIVLFNVLEHCRRPWVAVDNIHKWLRVGGKVFCMVPAVQRMHRLPKDYWRFMPDALETLFEKFGNLNLGTYGNLLASAACLAGLSAEELTVADLNHRDSRYPVAICLVAEKVSV